MRIFHIHRKHSDTLTPTKWRVGGEIYFYLTGQQFYVAYCVRRAVKETICMQMQEGNDFSESLGTALFIASSP